MPEEQGKPRRKRRWPRVVAAALAAVLVLCGVGFAAYVSDYYHACSQAESLVAAGRDASGAAISETDSEISVGDASSEYGVVLYPGAKVEAASYAPLACELADRGVYCSIAKMPCNLAFFGINSAASAIGDAAQVKHWWIAGHSLGGVVASQYAASNADDLEGIALLGSYTASDLSGTGLKALVVYGENDGVLNRDELAAATANLPDNAQTLVIEGGNHAGFGDYGAQSGDGEATISANSQQSQTAEALVSAMREGVSVTG